MKKFVFAIFTLMAVGLFTNPLFAQYCSKAPECVKSCSWMQTCRDKSGNSMFDIYNCGGSYAAVRAPIGYAGGCDNCRYNVEMKGGDFFVDGKECKPR